MHRDPPVVPTLAPTDHDGTDLKVHVGEIGGALLAWHPLGYGIWQSAVYGAIAGGSSAAVNGGNVLQGAAIGAFSAAAFAGLDGAGFGWGAAGDVGQHTLNIAASGVLGGTITVLQGGKFGNGAMTGAFMAAAAEIGSSSGDYSEGDGLTYQDSDINDPTGYYDSEGNPLLAMNLPSAPQGLVDGVTGFGDGVYRSITFGFGDLHAVRGALSIDEGVNYESGLYSAGHVAGTVEGGVAMGGAVAARAGFSTWVRRYPNAGGAGVGVDRYGKNLIRADWHKFKLDGEMVNRPHIDVPGTVKHWPW